MEKDILLSVIIPVYNTEKLICRCIASVLNQMTMIDNYEIIVINDGSTDDTLLALDFYKKNGNIHVFSQENKGVSIARQTGVSFSKGKYIMFVDSDDLLCNNDNDLGKIFSQLTIARNDIILVGMYHTFSTDKSRKMEKRYQSQEAIDKVQYISKLLTGDYDWGPYAKFFKRELFGNDSSIFVTDLSLGEDLVMNVKLASKANYISVNSSIFYNYIHREDSLTGQSEQDWDRSYYVDSLLSKVLISQNLYSQLKESFLRFQSNWLFDFLLSGQTLTDEKLQFLNKFIDNTEGNKKILSKKKEYFFRIMVRKNHSLLARSCIKSFTEVRKSISRFYLNFQTTSSLF